jgi:hypothetical protein
MKQIRRGKTNRQKGGHFSRCCHCYWELVCFIQPDVEHTHSHTQQSSVQHKRTQSVDKSSKLPFGNRAKADLESQLGKVIIARGFDDADETREVSEVLQSAGKTRHPGQLLGGLVPAQPDMFTQSGCEKWLRITPHHLAQRCIMFFTRTAQDQVCTTPVRC